MNDKTKANPLERRGRKRVWRPIDKPLVVDSNRKLSDVPRNVQRRERYANDAVFREERRNASRQAKRELLNVQLGSKRAHIVNLDHKTLKSHGRVRVCKYPLDGPTKQVNSYTAEELAGVLGGYSVVTIHHWWQKGWLPRPVLKVQGIQGSLMVYSEEEIVKVAAVLANHHKTVYYLMRQHVETIRQLRNGVIAIRKARKFHDEDAVAEWEPYSKNK